MKSPGNGARAPAEDEAARVAALRHRFAASFTSIFDHAQAPRTVLIAPSLTAAPEVMANVAGVHHYEEPMLCLLLLLRTLPNRRGAPDGHPGDGAAGRAGPGKPW